MPNSNDYNHFSVNPVDIDISRSAFDLSHSVKFSCNVGEVIPFDCIEVLPGDTFEIDTSKVIRLQPLVAPIMDEVILDTYWFYVPNRLVWSHWKEFMGENNESAWAPTTEYNIPTLSAPRVIDHGAEYYKWHVGTIADYLGIPVSSSNEYDTGAMEFNALPFRSYALICDQWFRSEAVMDPVHVHVDDENREGRNDDNQVYAIELGGKPFIACKYFDYFTSALPSPQRGESVLLDLVKDGQNLLAPVVNADGILNSHPYRAGQYTDNIGVQITGRTSPSQGASNTYNLGPSYRFLDAGGNDSHLDYSAIDSGHDTDHGIYFSNLFTSISSNMFQNISINDLRLAFQMQKYLEKQARYGGRYNEFIKGFFGVNVPDSTIQRSEYLGGSRISLNIHQVEQTSATQSGSTPLGDVAGMSVTGDTNSDFTKSFTEHGYIIGCAVVRYHHSYQDSIHKMWFRRTPYEFYNPIFANLGEMPIYKKEIFGYNEGVADDSVFGYNEAWAEYRTIPSRVCGELRSKYYTPLDMWHLSDSYTEVPSLSPAWLREDKSNLDRCLAVTSNVSNQVICDFYMKTKAVRCMPQYSIPGLIDHH